MFTDKLVFRWLEVLGVWSLDSATPVNLLLATIAYPAHASGLSGLSGSATGNLNDDIEKAKRNPKSRIQ